MLHDIPCFDIRYSVWHLLLTYLTYDFYYSSVLGFLILVNCATATYLQCSHPKVEYFSNFHTLKKKKKKKKKINNNNNNNNNNGNNNHGSH